MTFVLVRWPKQVLFTPSIVLHFFSGVILFFSLIKFTGDFGFAKFLNEEGLAKSVRSSNSKLLNFEEFALDRVYMLDAASS